MRRTVVIALLLLLLLTSACGTAPPSEPTATPSTTTRAVATAPAQDVPTGACAVVVKQVHRFEDMQPELATILDAPLFGAPYRVRMEPLPPSFIGVGVSVFGANWGQSVDVQRIGPDGATERYTNTNRPRANQSMTAMFRQVGTHVIEVSSASNECAATLVFEVVGPGL